MILRPPSSTRTYTLLPYPTLFRSYGCRPRQSAPWFLLHHFRGPARGSEARTEQAHGSTSRTNTPVGCRRATRLVGPFLPGAWDRLVRVFVHLSTIPRSEWLPTRRRCRRVLLLCRISISGHAQIGRADGRGRVV